MCIAGSSHGVVKRPLRLDTSLELLAERLAEIQGPCVVATVISAAGSTYRKPGARMLVEADGRITGLLSGGCFEQDLREHAFKILSSGLARTVTYDMRTDNDLIFGIGAGCEGCMRILLEPTHNGGATALAILQATSMSQLGDSVALASVHDGPDADLGTCLWHTQLQSTMDGPLASACAQAVARKQSQTMSWTSSGHPRAAWIQMVLPPPSVLICGAGPDAEPLVAGLRALHYPVTVVDHRSAQVDQEKFPGATLVTGPAASLSSRIQLNRFFAAVVMSHHFESDASYLRALFATSIEYLGVLGPKPRRNKLLSAIDGVSGGMEARLHGPIGLDIGAVTPEGIALSIAAEIHAAAAGRIGGSLKS